MATEHVNIADGERHEPKGAAAALDGQVYESDGAESGSWRYPRAILQVAIDDISTAGSVWVVSPIAGTIEKIYSVIDGAIATADCALTAEIGGTLVTGSGITITQAGSAAGDVDSSTPSAANTVAAGEAIEIITDGASTNTVKAVITIEIKGSV
jgi:hypothetical protein